MQKVVVGAFVVGLVEIKTILAKFYCAGFLSLGSQLIYTFVKTTVMKVILDIKDNKADFILEILKAFPSYVKAKPLTPAKSEFIEGLAESVKEVKLHKEGKIKLKSAQELLDEL